MLKPGPQQFGVQRLAWCVAVLCLFGLAPAIAQESGAGRPGGRLFVPEAVMAGRCTTIVSPNYPSGHSMPQPTSGVVIRAVIRSSGTVVPMYAVSGPHEFENAAMNAVRLWKFKPYIENDVPVDATTEIRVVFDPAKAGGIISHPHS
jgi:TonB family protein